MTRTFQKLSIDEFEKYIKGFNFTRQIKEFHVHHTWKPDHETLNKAKSYEAVIYSMYVYHTKTNGWQDIGQHISIDDNGDIWLCRDFNIAPASITGRNSYGFACETIGNFDKGNDVLKGKQLSSLIRCIVAIQNRFNFGNNGVIFHREFSSKTCPGTSIDKLWLLNLIDEYRKPKQLYRIRKSWEDVKSQLAAYENLDTAKSIVDKNAGYKIFDEQGTLVYPERHRAHKYLDSLNKKGYNFVDDDFDKTITLGELYEILDKFM